MADRYTAVWVVMQELGAALNDLLKNESDIPEEFEELRDALDDAQECAEECAMSEEEDSE